jgi:hypothetical protein
VGVQVLVGTLSSEIFEFNYSNGQVLNGGPLVTGHYKVGDDDRKDDVGDD